MNNTSPKDKRVNTAVYSLACASGLYLLPVAQNQCHAKLNAISCHPRMKYGLPRLS